MNIELKIKLNTIAYKLVYVNIFYICFLLNNDRSQLDYWQNLCFLSHVEQKVVSAGP